MAILHTQFASGALLTAGSDYGNLGTSGLNEITNRINVESGILGTVSGAGVINTTHRGLTNDPHSVTKTQVGLSNVPNTDFTSAVSSNTAASHTQGTDTTLGTMTENINMGGSRITNCDGLIMIDSTSIIDANACPVSNTGNVTPNTTASNVGLSGSKYGNIWALTVNEGDHVYSEKKCILCGKAFKKGESVVNYVLSNTEEGTRTIPVHMSCATLSENQTENKVNEVIQKLKDEGTYIDPIESFNKSKAESEKLIELKNK